MSTWTISCSRRHFPCFARSLRGVCAGLIMVVGLTATACGSRPPAEPTADQMRETLAEVSLPELSRVDAPVRDQIRDRHGSLTKLVASGSASTRDLGAAFGEYGMLLHATEYYQAAEPAYLNAQALVPDDVRWPYYLGHLYRMVGKTDAAMRSFQQVLDRRPDEVAALVWLGRMYLDHGDADRAEALFARAQSAAPDVVAAQVGLGQAALAKKDYARAARLLESAVQADPSVSSVYAPLALAYRGLGQNDKAESVSRLWRNTEILVPDPMRQELDTSVRSALSYELRGVRALEERDFSRAVEQFRQGLALAAPGSAIRRSLHHKLGTALALSGDTASAVREFEETLRLAPRDGLDEPAAKASYSLGLVLASNGRERDAIERLTAALRYNPNYLEAHMALADILRGSGRAAASLPHYREAVRLNPRAAEARFSYALALLRLGRYADARAWLEESVQAQPDRPELALALARLLASAPDPAVRDGRRALAVARELLTVAPDAETGETIAMALAETGAFTDAVTLQRDVLERARQAGREADVRRMTGNLRLFESGRPSRTPWPADDPIHTAVVR